MTSILTYQVNPYFLQGQPLPFQSKNATEWLRTVINRLYNSNKGRLRSAGIRTEIFHNHDESTSRTIVLYPLIIYHYVDSIFLVTGINEGKTALEGLFESIEKALEIDDRFLLKFKRIKDEDIEIRTTRIKQKYRLTDWLPLNPVNHKQYKTLGLIEKIKFLETILLSNLVNDFGKFLDLDFSKLKVKIFNIEQFQRSSLQYKGHDYLPFSLDFEANAELPDFITLGNGKAFGFGRINRIQIP
jgi:disulfide oxidoreductase YuzD